MKYRPAWSAKGIVGNGKGRGMVVLGTIVAAALVTIALGADSDSGGGAAYTPTQGEWLCVLLNMDEASSSDLQFPQGAGVRFRYDHTQPDTILIEVLYNPNVGAAERRNRAQHADQQAREMAKLKGWDGWLKIEHKEIKITGRPGVKLLDK